MDTNAKITHIRFVGNIAATEFARKIGWHGTLIKDGKEGTKNIYSFPVEANWVILMIFEPTTAMEHASKMGHPLPMVDENTGCYPFWQAMAVKGVKCGHCKQYHANTNEVRACYGLGPRTTPTKFVAPEGTDYRFFSNNEAHLATAFLKDISATEGVTNAFMRTTKKQDGIYVRWTVAK